MTLLHAKVPIAAALAKLRISNKDRTPPNLSVEAWGQLAKLLKGFSLFILYHTCTCSHIRTHNAETDSSGDKPVAGPNSAYHRNYPYYHAQANVGPGYH